MQITYTCRSCNKVLTHTLIDLGKTPIANDMVSIDKASQIDPLYPLHVYICDNCWLAQLPAYKRSDELFTDTYTYFSSFSQSWLAHAKQYVEDITSLLNLNKNSFVVELASNDGYLLQYVKELGIPHIGVEPSKSVADVAVEKGITIIRKFFGIETAKDMVKTYGKADLIIGNNVFAHVPDINDFMAGARLLLKETGTITYEFQYLPALIEKSEFDTIYHEHYSYYSLITLMNIAHRHDMKIWNLEMLSTHGGSIRVYFTHNNSRLNVKPIVNETLKNEERLGVNTLEYYQAFRDKVEEVKTTLLKLIFDIKQSGKRIAAYGAPAKGNTLLNYCGITKNDIDFTVDKNPYKQNKLLPGTHIPVLAPDVLRERKPDLLLILPWNLKSEIMTDNAYIREYGGKFIIPIPTPQII